MIAKVWLRAADAVLSPVMGRRECERLNREAARCLTFGEWARMVLRALDIEILVGGRSLEAVVPAAGPLAFVANHPFGILDGLVLAAVVSPLRTDVRYVGQAAWQRVPQVGQVLFALQPTAGRPFQRSNAQALRQAIQWVQSGHALAHFPAPTVARWSWSHRRVEDPEWSSLVGLLIRFSGACVVPIHFGGRNSLLFQAVGATCGRLRHALLLRELVNKRGMRIHVTVGPQLKSSEFPTDASAALISSQIRQRLEALPS